MDFQNLVVSFGHFQEEVQIALAFQLIAKTRSSVKRILQTYLQEEFLPEYNDVEHVKALLAEEHQGFYDKLRLLITMLKSDNMDLTVLYLKLFPSVFVKPLDSNLTRKIFQLSLVHPNFKNHHKLLKIWTRFLYPELRPGDLLMNQGQGLPYQDILLLNFVSENSYLFHGNGEPMSQIVDCIGYTNPNFLRAIYHWLKDLRLHKYLFFFSNLSYQEFLGINESNIDYFVETVGVRAITNGAKDKIIREVGNLRNRFFVLKHIKESNFIEPNMLMILQQIVRTPILRSEPNNNVYDESLINLIKSYLRRAVESIIRKLKTLVLRESDFLLAELILQVLRELAKAVYTNKSEKLQFKEIKENLDNVVDKAYLNSGLHPSEIYVGNLPAHWTFNEVLELFHRFGEIKNIRLLTSRKTNQFKQYGFVDFKCPESAVRAIQQINGSFLNGSCAIIVSRAWKSANPQKKRRENLDGTESVYSDTSSTFDNNYSVTSKDISDFSPYSSPSSAAKKRLDFSTLSHMRLIDWLRENNHV